MNDPSGRPVPDRPKVERIIPGLSFPQESADDANAKLGRIKQELETIARDLDPSKQVALRCMIAFLGALTGTIGTLKVGDRVELSSPDGYVSMLGHGNVRNGRRGRVSELSNGDLVGVAWDRGPEIWVSKGWLKPAND